MAAIADYVARARKHDTPAEAVVTDGSAELGTPAMMVAEATLDMAAMKRAAAKMMTAIAMPVIGVIPMMAAGAAVVAVAAGDDNPEAHLTLAAAIVSLCRRCGKRNKRDEEDGTKKRAHELLPEEAPPMASSFGFRA